MSSMAARPSARPEDAWESEGGAILLGDHGDRGDDASRRPRQDLPPLGRSTGPRSREWGSQPLTGSIIALRPGAFGLIASDAYGMPWRLPFRRAAVADDGFDRLRIGQRVRFLQVGVPGDERRRQAVQIVPFGDA